MDAAWCMGHRLRHLPGGSSSFPPPVVVILALPIGQDLMALAGVSLNSAEACWQLPKLTTCLGATASTHSTTADGA